MRAENPWLAGESFFSHQTCQHVGILEQRVIVGDELLCRNEFLDRVDRAMERTL